MIGVTADVNLFGIDPSDEQPPAVAYVPYAYQQAFNTGLTIRVEGDPASITSAVRSALRAADPNLPMFQARTIVEARRLSYWQYGLYGWIFGTIGVMGLLLAAIGVYGVLSYSGLAAHAGDRRARGARRRTARHSAASSSARGCCSPASASRSGWRCRPARCRSRGRSSTTSAPSIR